MAANGVGVGETPPASNTTANPNNSFENSPCATVNTATPSPAVAGAVPPAPINTDHGSLMGSPAVPGNTGQFEQGPSPADGVSDEPSRTPSDSGASGKPRPPPLNASQQRAAAGRSSQSPTAANGHSSLDNSVVAATAGNAASYFAASGATAHPSSGATSRVPLTPASRPSLFPDHSHSAVAEIAEAFRVLTSENSFDAAQLTKVMRAHGQQPTEEEVRELIKAIDQTGDGLVRFPEFASLMTQPVELEDINDMKSAFLELDRECKGWVSTSDFLMLMATFGERSKPEECEEMVRFADPDDTGRIDYHSFLSTLAYRLQPRM